MGLETFIGLLCLIPATIYFIIKEINWKFIWQVIKRWISL